MTESTDQLKDAQINAPLEHVFDRIRTPFEEFIHNESTSGIVLMVCAVLALAAANSAFSHDYFELIHTKIVVSIGEWGLEKSLQHWINDALMALFFFLAGLEIKREILVGELSDIRQAMLPVLAAIGGMLIPAFIYVGFTYNHAGINGWGIPMATDIAFAVGAMVLLRGRVNHSLLTFLVALAIVDDLGAVAVIAIFYTEQLNVDALTMAFLLFLLLWLFNLFGVRKPLAYFIVGVLLWIAMLKSGVHATVAGVLTAFTIPARAKFSPIIFSKLLRQLLSRFDSNISAEQNIMKNQTHRSLLRTLENGVKLAETPLQRLEHDMHLPVAFIIMPLFALANAGITIHVDQINTIMTHPITLGVFFGLVFGKLLGIAGFSWLALKLKIGRLPSGTRLKHIVGVALFGGIGFTMSIFIADLGFTNNPEFLLYAKSGILAASIVAGLLGYFWLSKMTPPCVHDSAHQQHASPDSTPVKV